MDRRRIKKIIQESGHSYRTLAEEIGVSPQAISEIVSGRTRGNTARYALAVALGVSVDDLWPGTTSRPPRDNLPSIPAEAGPRPFSEAAGGIHSVRRVAAVQATGLLGQGRSAAMDRLARIARSTAHAPLALLLLADGRRLHIIGGDGLPAQKIRPTFPLNPGPIGHVVASGEALAIGNLPADECFSADAILESLEAVAFAAAPLVDADDHVLGVIAIVDTRSRRWANGCLGGLQDVASAAAEAIAAQRHEQTACELRERLAEAEERFENLTEHSDQVFWISHLYSGRAVYVSPAFKRVYGVDGRRVTDEGAFLDLIHPEDRDRVAASLPRQVLGPYQHDYRVVHPDGAVRWIRSRATPVRNAAGETYRVMGVARDVTAEKRAERLLRRALDSFFATNCDSHEVLARGVQDHLEFKPGMDAAQTFGPFPSPDEAWGWWQERLHPTDRGPVLESIEEALRNRSGLWGQIYRFRASDDCYHRVLGTAFIFHGETVPGVIGIMEDLGPADP